MNRIFFFADLDDTLFTSIRKQQERELQPTAFLKDGSPFSAMNRKQLLFWKMLQNSGEIIPTTARNIDSFSRVKLDFNSRYAIVSNGAIILKEGRPEERWLTETKKVSQRLTKEMEALRDSLLLEAEKSFTDATLNIRLISDYEMPLFVLVKCSPATFREEVLLYFQDFLLEVFELDNNLFFIHRNGNNLAVYPNEFCKERAVQYLQQEILQIDQSDLTLGLGDSSSDISFMRGCDWLVCPKNSQIDNAL